MDATRAGFDPTQLGLRDTDGARESGLSQPSRFAVLFDVNKVAHMDTVTRVVTRRQLTRGHTSFDVRTIPPARLRQMREAAGLTQGELGARLGISKATVSRMENGTRRVQLEVVERWALACGFRLLVVDGITDQLISDAAALADADAELAARLVALLPALTPELRRTLDAQFRAWEDQSED